MKAIETLKSIPGKIEGRLFPGRKKRERIIYGEQSGTIVIPLEESTTMLSPVVTELNPTLNEVLQLPIIKDPLSLVSRVATIYESKYSEGEEEFKKSLLEGWGKIKKFLSSVAPKDPINPAYKKIYIGIIEICQSSEDVITLTSEISLKPPKKKREHHLTTFTFLSCTDNPNKLEKVSIEDHDLCRENASQSFLLGGF